jgi:plasmid stabilization system protein ParE
MSEYRLVIHPVAANDISDARDWYESQRDGLGAEFLDEVQAALVKLRHAPSVHPLTYKEYRQFVIRRFPYVIHYHVEGDRVSVVGVFHGHRDPRSWMDRIDRLFDTEG